MKMRKVLTIGMVLAASFASFAQEGDSIAVALGPVTAIDVLQQKAEKDGKADVLEVFVRGVETALTAELSNNDSPFALIGGNIGANLYKKIVVDQKSPTESDGEDMVQYGLSVEITSFADAQIGPTQSGGLTVIQREITVMASAVMHDVGRMRAEIAIPSVTATGKRTHSIRSQNELDGVMAQDDILIGEAQKDLAKKLAAGLLEAYAKFPATILKVDGDEITIDQGKSWCQVGDELSVYGSPEVVEKTSKGRIKTPKSVLIPGKKIGTLTITDVFGDTSRGLLKGNGAVVDGIVYKKGE